jgi:L-iditol 2-dehydrogenase
MDRKVPHVLGHEVCGKIVESQDSRFPMGSRVFPHHHAAALSGAFAQSVHSEQWKQTKLVPGGMAEYFAVPEQNLDDTHIVDDLRAQDAALIEPLACVMKSLRLGGPGSASVLGLGVMGLMHMLALENSTGVDPNIARVKWAKELGMDAYASNCCQMYDVIYVCPGSQQAFDDALEYVQPGGTIVMFAPLPPQEDLVVPQEAYFHDLTIRHSYSCAQPDVLAAINIIRAGRVTAEQVVSHQISLDELPAAYQAMKAGQILKPMVLFPN